MVIEFLVLLHHGLRNAAREIGIDAGYLSRLMNGEMSNPSDETLGKLGLRRVVSYELIKEFPNLF